MPDTRVCGVEQNGVIARKPKTVSLTLRAGRYHGIDMATPDERIGGEQFGVAMWNMAVRGGVP